MERLLTEDERVAAAMGRGVEVAERKMSLFKAEKDPMRGVDHALAAIDALTLHLQHLEADARQFAKTAAIERPDIPDDPATR